MTACPLVVMFYLLGGLDYNITVRRSAFIYFSYFQENIFKEGKFV